jgi:hypothetical protein
MKNIITACRLELDHLLSQYLSNSIPEVATPGLSRRVHAALFLVLVDLVSVQLP